MKKMPRWDVRFYGREPEVFLELLQDLWTSYKVWPENIPKCITGVVWGVALQCLLNRRHRWTGWKSFLCTFKTRLILSSRPKDLGGESAKTFTISLEMLIP
ncbi:hypothetical protein KM043_016504 [Ampulex compressa]|nr:hypothetical protein KM043_016504 [Ampulex compressa]